MVECAAGRGFEGVRTRAPESNTTKSNRDAEYRTGTRAERATSGVDAKMSSSRFVDTHKTRDKVGFALVFFGGGQRKPMRFGHSARFARVEGEVRKNSKAEDYWRGGGEVKCKCRYKIECLAHPTRPRTRLSIPRRCEEHCTTAGLAPRNSLG